MKKVTLLVEGAGLRLVECAAEEREDGSLVLNADDILAEGEEAATVLGVGPVRPDTREEGDVP